MTAALPISEWVYPPTNAELLAMLRDARVRLSISTDRGDPAPRLLAVPRAAVSPELAKTVQHHKPALVRALKAHLFDTLEACPACSAEFVVAGSGRCMWCRAVAGRVVEYAPESAAERALLASRERFQMERGFLKNCPQLSPGDGSPNCPRKLSPPEVMK